MIQFVKNLLRRHLRSERVYAYSRRLMVLYQLVSKKPDEEDLFGFAACLSKPGPVIDCGANGGQSAVAFAFIANGKRIISFEPNPALWPELEFVQRRIGDRHEIRRAGVGAESGILPFYIPMIGELAVTTQASLDREQTIRVSERLGREYGGKSHVEEVQVEIVALDDTNLKPAGVKIDVEGGELDTLRGMTRILREDRPIIMLEALVQKDDCQALLAEYGYEFAFWHTDSKQLRKADNGSRNWFAIPSEEAAEVINE